MLLDVLEDQLALSGALPRTLFALLFRPGRLTNEYIRGRIVSYIAPFRLYLVASVLFFLLFSFIGLAALERAEIDIDQMGDVAEVRAALERFEWELANTDTTVMSAAARASLVAMHERLQTALAAAIEDSAASHRASVGISGDGDGGPTAPAPPLAGTPAGADRGTMQASGAAPGDTAVAGDAAADTMGMDGDTAVTVPALTPEQARLQPWARSIRSNTPFPALDRAVQRKVQQVGHLNPREALSQVLREYVEFVPHLVFVLLPVFALLLKLLYIRRDRYYAEHFVFALHTHAFAFLMFTLMLLLPWRWLDRALLFWMAVYVWIAMRTVYAQGVARTTIKWWVLGWSYLWVFAIGMISLAIVTLLIT